MREDRTEAQAARLVQWVRTTQRLTELSNAALADLVVDHLWADLRLGSPHSDLLAEVIERLRRCPGV